MKILFVAGGTGGHIFPALATMQKMRELDPTVELLWVTTLRNNERLLAEQFNVPMQSLAVEGFQRKVSIQPLRAFVKFVRAVIQMTLQLNKKEVHAVVAYGGYVCGPVVVAAKVRGIPVYLHEQNSVPGAVNRLYAKQAKRIFLGMPLAEGWQLAGETRVVGTPVRPATKRVETQFTFPPEINTALDTVFICGGSQGAMSMNRVLFEAVDWMVSKGLQVIWQTGDQGLEEIKQRYIHEPRVIANASIAEMYPYYELAKVVVGRAGASTICEAALYAKPSVFIPLPWSAENHQWFNAGFAEMAGWARRVEQGPTTSEVVRIILDEILFTSPTSYIEMQEAAAKTAVASAAETVAREVLSHDK